LHRAGLSRVSRTHEIQIATPALAAEISGISSGRIFTSCTNYLPKLYRYKSVVRGARLLRQLHRPFITRLVERINVRVFSKYAVA